MRSATTPDDGSTSMGTQETLRTTTPNYYPEYFRKLASTFSIAKQVPPEWYDQVAQSALDSSMTECEKQRIKLRNAQYYEYVPPLWENTLLRRTSVLVSYALSTVLIRGLNTLITFDLDKLHDYILNRTSRIAKENADSLRSTSRDHILPSTIESSSDCEAPVVPLLTVMNHKSILDDPILTSAIIPLRAFLNVSKMRWGICAFDVCFRQPLTRAIVTAGKVLSIVRGVGLSQRELYDAVKVLDQGDWLHMFPEGKVEQGDPDRMELVRRGIGKIVAQTVHNTGRVPVILPIYHQGIENVMPEPVIDPDTPFNPELEDEKSKKNIDIRVPSIMNRMYVQVGEAIEIKDILQSNMDCLRDSEALRTDAQVCIKLYEEICLRISISLRLTRAQLRIRVKDEMGVDLGDPFAVA